MAKEYSIWAVLVVVLLVVPALASDLGTEGDWVSDWVTINANPAEIAADGVSTLEIKIMVSWPEGGGEPADNETVHMWTALGGLTELGNESNTGRSINVITDGNGTATALLSGNETGIATICVGCPSGGWNFTDVTFRDQAVTAFLAEDGALPKTWYVDDSGGANFTNIQDAVDNATAGDTIIVRDGTYTENVVVGKELTIRSENGYAKTLVRAARTFKHVFTVTADNATIQGFTVTGAVATPPYYSYKTTGIALGKDVDHCNITDNKVTDNTQGISLSFLCENNMIKRNIVNANNIFGIFLYWGSNGNKIEDNIVDFNGKRGISLHYANSNEIVGNTVSSNGNYGIFMENSKNNQIYHNNFMNNTINAADDKPERNLWNHTILPEGNYWSDYTGVDDGSGTGKHAIAGDGIGDTEIPYPAAGFDFYPFMHENLWESLWEITEKRIETATGTGLATLSIDKGYFSSAAAVNESSLPQEGKPNIIFPHGFFTFIIGGLKSGDNVTVTMELPADLTANSQYWKYSSQSGGWYNISMAANDGDNLLTFILEDGGVGDADGRANGVISDPGGPALLADLTLNASDLSFVPVNPAEDDCVNVNITAIVHNIGGADANNFTVSFTDGTALIGDIIISARANSSSNASILWTAASGEHNISVVADAGNEIVESNDTNNEAEKAITVQTKPELCTTDISFSPVSPTEGESVTITAVINNTGWSAASDFTASFFVDGALIGNITNISVNALSSSKATITWLAVSGKHNIRVFADSYDVIQESNETNNNASRTITVNTKEYRRTGGGGGGGGASRDTDGDGYSDMVEMFLGTDWKDPDDYPGAASQTPTPTAKPTPTVTHTFAPTETPTSTATPIPSRSPKSKRRLPGFEVVFSLAVLFVVAYRVRKSRD